MQSNRNINIKINIAGALGGRRKDVSKTLENRIALRSVATFLSLIVVYSGIVETVHRPMCDVIESRRANHVSKTRF